mgnify:CR=1 FL=1
MVNLYAFAMFYGFVPPPRAPTFDEPVDYGFDAVAYEAQPILAGLS